MLSRFAVTVRPFNEGSISTFLPGNVGQGAQDHGGIGGEEVDRDFLALLAGLDQLVGVIRRYRLDLDRQLVVCQVRLVEPASAGIDVDACQVAHGARSHAR
jgi:hypothetical protein